MIARYCSLFLMRTIAGLALLITFMLTSGLTYAASGPDNSLMKAVFEADQTARSPKSIKAGRIPTLQEERDRRFTVFQLLAENQLRTANDYFRAGVVLHHTGSIRTRDGVEISLGTESKLLAFFLFKRARELGHSSGQRMMAAAYNYYLHACGENADRYGYKFVDGGPIWRPSADELEADELKCGFDPRPHLEQGVE